MSDDVAELLRKAQAAMVNVERLRYDSSDPVVAERIDQEIHIAQAYAQIALATILGGT